MPTPPALPELWGPARGGGGGGKTVPTAWGGGGKGGGGVQRQASVGSEKGPASGGTEPELPSLPWRPVRLPLCGPRLLHRSYPSPLLPRHLCHPSASTRLPCTSWSPAGRAPPFLLPPDHTQALGSVQFLAPLGRLSCPQGHPPPGSPWAAEQGALFVSSPRAAT